MVSFGQASATGLSRILPDINHDQVTRFLAQETLADKDLWRIVKPHLRKIQSDDAVLIIDDTVEEKPYTDQSELITWHFDHVQNRSVKGINLVSCLYSNEQASLPVAFHLVQKTERVTDKKTGKDKWQSSVTKNEIARQMVASTIAKQIPFRYILADVWFSCAENMTFFKKKAKKDFILPLKRNRKVAVSPQSGNKAQWQSLDSLDFDAAPLQTLYLEDVPFPLLVMRLIFKNEDDSQGMTKPASSVLYLCSSDLSLSTDDFSTLYQKRWRVEEYHKSLKSNAAFSKSPTKLPRTQSNHCFASLIAFVKMEMMRLQTKCNSRQSCIKRPYRLPFKS